VARHASTPKYPVAWLGLFSVYLILAIIATYPLAFQATNHVFGLGTPPLNIWALSWVNHQLVQDPVSLFDGNVFFRTPGASPSPSICSFPHSWQHLGSWSATIRSSPTTP